MNSSIEASFPCSNDFPPYPISYDEHYRQPASEETVPGPYDYVHANAMEQDSFSNRIPGYSYYKGSEPVEETNERSTNHEVHAGEVASYGAPASHQQGFLPGQYLPRPDANLCMDWVKTEDSFASEEHAFWEYSGFDFSDASWDSFSREAYAEYWGAPRDEFSAAKSHQLAVPSPQQMYTTDPSNSVKLSSKPAQVAVSYTDPPMEAENFFAPISPDDQGAYAPPRPEPKRFLSEPYLPRDLGPMKRFRNVRNVANRGKKFPFDSSSRTIYIPTKLEITGASIEEINQVAWDPDECSDGRRIVRIEARQYGPIIHGSFHVVGSAKENPVMTPAPRGVDATEVSCLQYVSIEKGVPRFYYYITSVELVNIIDTLINIKVMGAGYRRREKGRIRSNLSPYWSKNSLGSTRSIEEQDSADPRTQFARRISNYGVRRPRCLDKDVRVLSWSKLVTALERAVKCYYTEIPVDDRLTAAP